TPDLSALSLHDALPIWIASTSMPTGTAMRRNFSLPDVVGARMATALSVPASSLRAAGVALSLMGSPLRCGLRPAGPATPRVSSRSEEHTSELQSRENLV